MRLIALIISFCLGVISYGQSIIIPPNILNQVRTNVNQVFHYSLAASNDGVLNYIHSDLINLGYSHVKISTDYFLKDNYRQFNNYQQIRLKVSLNKPILRKLSLSTSCSLGTTISSNSELVYSANASFYSYMGSIGYQLNGIGNNLSHSVQIRYEKAISKKKYSVVPVFSFVGNLNLGEFTDDLINPTYGYTHIRYKNFKVHGGVYGKNQKVLPMLGMGFKRRTGYLFKTLELHTIIFFNEGDIPTVQGTLSLSLRNRRGRHIFRMVPGNLSF